MAVSSGRVPMLEDGRFPDRFAPLSVAADAAAAATARAGAEAAAAGVPAAVTAEVTTQVDPKVTAAQTARTGAETARTGAETAKTGAETARTGAETARTGAEAALAGVPAAVETQITTPGTPTRAALNATYVGLIQAAKNPDLLIAGAVTLDGSDQVTSAVVQWPDGTPGALTITARHATGAVTAYNITYGSPVTKTFTQQTITRNANGAPTNIPQIVVS